MKVEGVLVGGNFIIFIPLNGGYWNGYYNIIIAAPKTDARTQLSQSRLVFLHL